jgi:hypothetical protein
MMFYIELLEWLARNPALSFFVLFIQFVLIMKIHHKAHNKYLHILLGAWFLPQDFVVNLVLFSIIGGEIPQEATVTARMKRWKELNGSKKMIERWRCLVANYLCNILNKYDAGHC